MGVSFSKVNPNVASFVSVILMIGISQLLSLMMPSIGNACLAYVLVKNL